METQGQTRVTAPSVMEAMVKRGTVKSLVAGPRSYEPGR